LNARIEGILLHPESHPVHPAICIPSRRNSFKKKSYKSRYREIKKKPNPFNKSSTPKRIF